MNEETTPPWRAKLTRVWRFVTEDVWDLELSALSVRRRFGVSALRVVQLVWKDFRRDECPLHASALTFSTLMSIVPVLALSLALARGLGGEEAAKSWIRNSVADWTSGFAVVEADVAGTLPTVTDVSAGLAGADGSAAANAAPRPSDPVDPAALAHQINHMVEAGFKKMENISFGALGGVGLGLLVWMVIAVLGRVEASFNRVWGVTSERRLYRKFTDYLSVLFVLPDRKSVV